MTHAFDWSTGYASRRSPVFARNIVSTSHPLGAQAGLKMLQQGGNAVDAAVAATLAISVVEPFSAGLGARPTFGAFTPFAALRVKHLGDRPANENHTLTAEGFTVVDANVGVRHRALEVGVDVQNVFDVRWREVQFATTSRLAYEPATVAGIAMTPGWPRTVIARFALYGE